MYYFVQFQLNHSEGDIPSQLSLEQIKQHLTFNVFNENNALPIESFQLLDNGLEHLSVENGRIKNELKPVVYLKLTDDVDPDDADAWSDLMLSDYKLSVPGVNDQDPCFIGDVNGNLDVMYAENLAEALADKLFDISQMIVEEEFTPVTADCSITRQHEFMGDQIQMHIVLKYQNEDYTWSWTFEDADAMGKLDFSENYYKDHAGNDYPEQQAMLWHLHKIMMDYEV